MNAYFESIAGISSGGKTGLSAIMVAGCFLFALFFTPAIALVPHYAIGACLFITAGETMIHAFKQLPWHRVDHIIPFTLTILTIPLSSIPNGIGLGMVSYFLLTDRSKQPSGLKLLVMIFVFYFFMLFIGNQ